MQNFDESNLTEAVMAAMAEAPAPRTRAISQALVRHLHGFIREVQPTQAEWEQAIDFLTRVGRMCSDTRQEFILLSDTLGASMLVDAINHRPARQHSEVQHSGGQHSESRATETTVLGPFYVADPPEFPLGSDIAGGLAGETLLVEGSVRDPAGAPIAGAVVDTWQADAEGAYDVQRPAGLAGLTGRARLRTDGAGAFRFRTIVPSSYPVPDDGPVGEMLRAQGRHPFRPAHIHFRIAAPGCETLVTHIFLAGDRYLDSDAVFGVKTALIAPVTREAGTARLRYAFVLAAARPARA